VESRLTYNLTNVTAAENLLEIAIASNGLANNMLFLFLTIGLWLILTIIMVNRGILAAIATSSFVTGLAGILFVLSGLISQDFLIYYILVMGLAVSAAFVAGRGE